MALKGSVAADQAKWTVVIWVSPPAHDLRKKVPLPSGATGPRGSRCVAVLGWRASCHRLTITSATLPPFTQTEGETNNTQNKTKETTHKIHRVNRNPAQQASAVLGQKEIVPFHPANPPNKPVTNVRYTLLADSCHRRPHQPQCGRWHQECENFDTVSQPSGTTQ